MSEYPLVTAAIELVDNACAVFFVAEYLLRLICRFLSLIYSRDHQYVKYEVRSPKFSWAPCHAMCTAVLIG